MLSLNRKLTKDELIFVRKCFKLKSIQQKFVKWFDTNMICCEDTHSFVHRLFDCFDAFEDYRDAQHMAFEILDIMRFDFLAQNYDLNKLKRKVSKMLYFSPLDILIQKIEGFNNGNQI